MESKQAEEKSTQKKDDVKEDSKQLMDELTKTHAVTKTGIKLNRKILEVNIYRHTSAVEALEQELSLTSDAITKTKDKDVLDHLDKRKKFCETELDKHENDKIEGTMTPLTYRDIVNIKAAVTEAVLDFQKFNFDQEVQMIRVAAEERLMTVFCALKCKDNLKQTFFKTLEEIVVADDATIAELYAQWDKHFLNTDEEIKN